MRYEPTEAADDWSIFEIVVRSDRPCSDAYADANDEDLLGIFHALRLLKAAGCPPDRLRGNPDVQSWKGKCTKEHGKTQFFVLKTKPSGWRLYFMVPCTDRREIVFLYAVNKKRNERDQKDFAQLCRRRREYFSGRPDVKRDWLDIPPR